MAAEWLEAPAPMGGAATAQGLAGSNCDDALGVRALPRVKRRDVRVDRACGIAACVRGHRLRASPLPSGTKPGQISHLRLDATSLPSRLSK